MDEEVMIERRELSKERLAQIKEELETGKASVKKPYSDYFLVCVNFMLLADETWDIVSSGKLSEMSAEELEDACRKSLRVTVTDAAALTAVLDDMGLSYSVTDENHAEIYARPNISELVFALADKKCQLISCSEQEETLEGFFISLVGGGSNE